MATKQELQQEQWKQRHADAMTQPRGIEAPIVVMFNSLKVYAGQYNEQFGKIGEDLILGDAFMLIVRGLRGLLNGETGRLDCGTLDSDICNMCRMLDFPEEEL